MGEIANMMLTGIMCEGCGEYLMCKECEEMEIPMYCSEDCARNRGITDKEGLRVRVCPNVHGVQDHGDECNCIECDTCSHCGGRCGMHGCSHC